MRCEHALQDIKNKVQEYLGDRYTVCIKTIIRINDTVRYGLEIREGTEQTAPVIHLNQYLSAYEQGEPLDEIADDIIDKYMNEAKAYPAFDYSILADAKQMKKRITFQLINRERNEAYLKDTPYISWNDLAIIFKGYIAEAGKDLCTFTIKNVCMELWNMNVSDLYKAALENTPQLMPVKMIGVDDMIADVCPQLLEEVAETPFDSQMIVLTNQRNLCGSICILYPHVLENIAKKLKASFYILPSSIHETMLLPEADKLSAEGLKDMVREVNLSDVSEEERLSDNIYYYNMHTKEISQL